MITAYLSSSVLDGAMRVVCSEASFEDNKHSPMDILTIYSRSNRNTLLILAVSLTCCIAAIDWYTRPYISIGFLYLFPMMLISGIFRRWHIVLVAVAFAFLQEIFSNLPFENAIARLIFSWAGFAATGLFVFELLRNRRLVLRHLEEVERQVQQRKQAEEQLRMLVDTSPAAIVIVGSSGEILLANDAALEMLSSGAAGLQGQFIGTYIPALATALKSPRPFRTTVHCRAQRTGGEAFLAGTWFSTYNAPSGSRLAAIIVDLSEELCSREDLSLDYLLKNARILMSAVSHEIRNLSGAATVFYQNLSQVGALRRNEDFVALGTLIHGLEKLSALELANVPEQERQAIELAPVMDELRVLIETICREGDIELEWAAGDLSVSVWADRYGLIQVFLNLVKNSRRALESAAYKRIRISAVQHEARIVIHFDDTGPGVADPDVLFRPFQRQAEATGLGLYISRALMKSFGGDLYFEPAEQGCSVAIALQII
jgi:two-component system, LuxR family, sensor kinase FixL